MENWNQGNPDHAMWAFVAYLILISIIGIGASRFSSRGIAHYFIGGRKMSMLVVAMSAVVSGRSAWLLLGVTGMAWSMGFSAIWAVLGYTLVEFFLFFFYAPRLRRYTETHDCITLTDFFTRRFQDHRGRLRILMTLIIMVFMLSYVSAQFVAGGKAFHSGFSMSFQQGIIITTFIILFYTMLGGFLAVSLTDTIQGFIMLSALIFLPLMSVIHLGGWNAFVEQASAINQGGFFHPTALGFGAMIGFLGIGLGSPGNPHIVSRYMSISDPGRLRTAAWVGTAANILMATGAILTGMAGRIYFPELNLLPASDTESIYPLMASVHLPPLWFGVVMASVFAAIMSTADSQLLVAASALIRDMGEKYLWKDREIPPARLVLYSRISVVLLVALALALGLLAEQLVFWLVLFAWAGLGAAFGPASIMALYWKGMTRQGAIAGMLTGALTAIIWNRIAVLSALIYELVPAFILASLACWLVSLYTRVDPEDIHL